MTNPMTKKRIFIVEYGYELFNKGGFSNVKINRIAKAGNISNMSIYYIFGTKEALENDILTIALGSFKRKFSCKIAHSINDLNSRLLAALKEVPGLIYEINRYNKVVIDHLISIIAPLLSNSVRINIKANLLLLCTAITLTQDSNLKITSQQTLQIIENMNRNLNFSFHSDHNRVYPDDSGQERLRA
ncbi:MAG: TetR/AcrR family transcriptional regulator [Lactobacillus sp.]